MARVLVLINPATLQIISTKDYLASFEIYSNNDVSYLPEVPPPWKTFHGGSTRSYSEYTEILSSYDAIVISQHLRPCFDGWINDNLNNALLKYRGVKILFLHDEYDYTEKTRVWIEQQAVDLVYTVVPQDHISKVYPSARFGQTQFRNVLTGYKPLRFGLKHDVKPIASRDKLITYRGRVSPQSYGDLAKQKETIGLAFDKYCAENNIDADIQWEEAERVYGLDWYKLIENGVSTLGTESGSNVFDEYGKIRAYIARGGVAPGPSSLNFREENLGFKMNQISPRLFEAIGCGTVLVLYEGKYSGLLESGLHYLSVKHDNSNIGEIIDSLNDTASMQEMVDRTWDHIDKNSTLTFRWLINQFDSDLSERIIQRSIKPVINRQSSLSVGDFGDTCATAIGVFSELYSHSVEKDCSIRRWLQNHPVLLRIARLAIYWLRKLWQIVYHWTRTVLRVIPNRYPILGKIRRHIIKRK